MHEAAYTKPGALMPAYINIQRDHIGAFILTVRGEAQAGKMGATVVLSVEETDWHQLMADAARLRPTEGSVSSVWIDGDFTDEEKADMKYVAETSTSEEDAAFRPQPRRANFDGDVDQGAPTHPHPQFDEQGTYTGPQGDPWPGTKASADPDKVTRGLPDVGEVTSASDRAG